MKVRREKGLMKVMDREERKGGGKFGLTSFFGNWPGEPVDLSFLLGA